MTWVWQSPVASPHDHPPHPLAELIARLDSIFRPLIVAVAVAVFSGLLARQPHLAILTPAPVLQARLTLATTRLGRACARIAALLLRLAEGTWQPPRPHVPRATPRRSGPSPYLPRRRGWLGHVTDHHVRGRASQLTHLLNDPGTAAILARAPAQARATLARLLRGPARMLALDLPTNLQFHGPPRPPRKRRLSPLPLGRGEPEGGSSSPRAPKPGGGLLPTDRPLSKEIIAFARHNRRRFGKGG